MNDAAIFILRVTIGIIMIAHGVPKLFWKRKIFNKKWKEEYGFPLGSVVLTGIAQVAGGLAITVGLFTSWAALILALNMVVATYISIWNHGEGFLSTPEGKGWDVNLLLLVGLIALVLFGDGYWSLARWLG